uniref:Replication enhancer n=1 Tax=Soybean chlorotic blotch virus TaxID=761702 RepID=A0A182AY28_9GEMI|nr:AC3 [Soybean chlorotic blotch virus]ALO02529.1 AC3 [Soybean chlorotic blotch virus]ALO02545.1 AC3 [Soybean chlorotic blotch virus]ALO02553.1 AC3 [Soybean chlorotic blotch virus]ALO02821.1 AC3 [Soybean chlorotic blotch virus]
MDLRTGEPITAVQAGNGVYIWAVPNPLHFRVIEHHMNIPGLPYNIIKLRVQFNHNLRRALGLHKCWITLTILTRLTRSTNPTGIFLRVFKTQVLRYLDSIHVISINGVIRAINHCLYDVLIGTEEVRTKYEIKFNLY